MEIILIILAIVSALSGLFKDKSDRDTGPPKRSHNPPKPTPTPSGGGQGGGTEAQNEPQTSVSTVSIEEQQNEQRRQLAERMNTVKQNPTEQREHDAISHHDTRRPENNLSAERHNMKRQMNSNLTRTGVINGVIMSEVLGQPRAVKPYRSIVSQRKK